MSSFAQLDLPLFGTSALVTGGGTGIGFGIARQLVRGGAHVTIAGRREALLRDSATVLSGEAPAGVVVTWQTCDVTEEEEVASAIATAQSSGPLRIAVASAGGGSMGPIHAMRKSAWDATIAQNLGGTFLTIKHAAPAMAANGGGSIVAVSSIAGLLTHRYLAAYAVSKSAVDALVRNAADELGHAGIRVNGVRPGLVHTDMGEPFEQDPNVHADYLAQMPLGRVGSVDDVASLVRFLCGPESSWITGQIIGCDGGHSLRRGPDISHWATARFGSEVIDRLEPRRPS